MLLESDLELLKIGHCHSRPRTLFMTRACVVEVAGAFKSNVLLSPLNHMHALQTDIPKLKGGSKSLST